MQDSALLGILFAEKFKEVFKKHKHVIEGSAQLVAKDGSIYELNRKTLDDSVIVFNSLDRSFETIELWANDCFNYLSKTKNGKYFKITTSSGFKVKIKTLQVVKNLTLACSYEANSWYKNGYAFGTVNNFILSSKSNCISELLAENGTYFKFTTYNSVDRMSIWTNDNGESIQLRNNDRFDVNKKISVYLNSIHLIKVVELLATYKIF